MNNEPEDFQLPPHLQKGMDDMAEDFRKREAKIAADTAAGIDINAFIYTDSMFWERESIRYFIRLSHMGNWTGYCKFHSRPVMEPGYNGILTYVPVHGGITWARPSPDGSMVYGFDCAHADDTDPETYEEGSFEKRLAKVKATGDERHMHLWKPRSQRWLKREVETMGRGIAAAAQYEAAYLAAADNLKERATVLDNMHKYFRDEAIGKWKLGDNTGAMLNLLCGKL